MGNESAQDQDPNADISTEDIAQLLVGTLTHEDIAHRRMRKLLNNSWDKITRPTIIKFYRTMTAKDLLRALAACRKYHNRLGPSHRIPYPAWDFLLKKFGVENGPEWKNFIYEFTFDATELLKEVLATKPHATKPHVNNKPEAKALRRKLAKQNHGQGKNKNR